MLPVSHSLAIIGPATKAPTSVGSAMRARPA
ncbi:hypothetical protein SMICM304S_11144 [Streptomyces microflavus]